MSNRRRMIMGQNKETNLIDYLHPVSGTAYWDATNQAWKMQNYSSGWYRPCYSVNIEQGKTYKLDINYKISTTLLNNQYYDRTLAILTKTGTQTQSLFTKNQYYATYPNILSYSRTFTANADADKIEFGYYWSGQTAYLLDAKLVEV